MFILPKKAPRHVDEVIKLLAAITGDKRIAETWKVVDEEGDNMSEKWIDVIEARGEAKRMAIGETRGKILAYRDMGLTIDEIAKKINVSIDQVRKVLGLEAVTE